MLKKLKVMLLLVALTISIGMMSNTYSRYVAGTKGDISAALSKWQILIDNTDITNNNQSSVNITPIIEENEFIANNTIAPTSKGYFDINIDPSNVEVSFNYNIDIQILNENIPDLIISKYAIIPETYIDGDVLDIVYLENGNISKSLFFNKNVEQFKFKQFTIRVYFEWYEGTLELMNDEADTVVGSLAVVENTTLQMTANINFEQIIE